MKAAVPLLAAFLVALAAPSVEAQLGSVRGIVKDQSGHPVKGATVSIESEAFTSKYSATTDKATPLNNAFELYLKAPNVKRLQFCLLVANHEGFRIGHKDWDVCCEKWIELFQKPAHLRLDGQPLLIFFAPDELQKALDGVDGVRKAFDSLQAKAKQAQDIHCAS